MLQWSPLASSIPITFLHDTPRYCKKKKTNKKNDSSIIPESQRKEVWMLAAPNMIVMWAPYVLNDKKISVSEDGVCKWAFFQCIK